MVSSAIGMELEVLLGVLARLRRDYVDSLEYQELRGALPSDWPL